MTVTGSPDEFAAPSAWPKRPDRLGTAVVDVLLDRIVSGELEPGTLLPTEPRLCEVFGVSRTVIREAVKILEQKGLARARQGQGTRVALPDEWNLLDPMVLAASVHYDKDLRILDDLVNVRRVLESEMAGQSALKATADERALMQRILDQLIAEVATPERHTQTDVEFHDVIMRSSGNRLGRAVVRVIHSQARASDRYTGFPLRSDCEASDIGHQQIYDRINAGDQEGAARAMSEHILYSWFARRREAESPPAGMPTD